MLPGRSGHLAAVGNLLDSEKPLSIAVYRSDDTLANQASPETVVWTSGLARLVPALANSGLGWYTATSKLGHASASLLDHVLSR